ncbi:MAG TPA: caspase family protein [Candidatus Cloacimonadota bacterium]|nr:caspase family protein [Candidatus Cloacimonadota bacterium]
MKRVLILFLIFGFCQMAFASRRALVIGNSDYSERPLRNPVADAELMCASLEELGFTVTKVLNADRNRFNREVNQFSQTVQAEDEIVFFYSGHGLQVNGSNYLFPIREYFNDELDVEHKAVSLNLITEKLSQAKITLVFLDACRDNPYQWARSGARGLAVIPSQPVGSIIVYATSAGDVALEGQEWSVYRRIAEIPAEP